MPFFLYVDMNMTGERNIVMMLCRGQWNGNLNYIPVCTSQLDDGSDDGSSLQNFLQWCERVGLTLNHNKVDVLL